MNKLCDILSNELIWLCVFAMYELSIGVSEGVYLAKYHDVANSFMSEYKQMFINKTITNDPYVKSFCDIWTYDVAICVFNLYFALILCGIIFETCRHGGYCDDYSQFQIQIMSFFQFVFSVISAIFYSRTSIICKNFWSENTPQLWTFFVLNYLTLWVFVGIISLSVVICVISILIDTRCCGKIKRKYNVVASNNNTQSQELHSLEFSSTKIHQIESLEISITKTQLDDSLEFSSTKIHPIESLEVSTKIIEKN